MLKGHPKHAINVYVIGDVLIDAATRRAGRRIMRQIEGRGIKAHALTHAHADHQGATHEVCEKLGLPLWCGEHDADAMEQGTIEQMQPDHPVNRVISRFWLGPPHPVARRLREGDEVAGFVVLDAPGHSPGHIALWRESDRTLVCGDVFFNMPSLRPPPRLLTYDPQQNRASMRRLAELRPALALFGHGPPLRDPDRLAAVAAA
jgi:glyoxylase-like metal-dependent hydrolase (beta-lactamase superfamily II)